MNERMSVMKKSKTLIVWLIIVLLVVSISGCSSSDQSQTGDKIIAETTQNSNDENKKDKGDELKNPNISFMWWNPVDEKLDNVIKGFNEKYNANAKVIETTWGEMGTKLVAGVATGEPVDLAYLYGSFFPTQVIKNLYQPVEPFIDLKNPMWDLTKMEAFKWKGKYYGICSKRSCDLYVVFYNKTMLENNGMEMPADLDARGEWNWEKFKKMCIDLTIDKDNDGKVDQWAMSTGGKDFLPLMQSNGNTLIIYDKSGKPVPNFGDTKTIDAFKFMQELRHKYKVLGDGEFKQGNAAFFVTGPWEAKSFKDSGIKDEWDVVCIPLGPENIKKTTSATMHSWGIPVGARNPEGGAQFFKYWMEVDPVNVPEKDVFNEEQVNRLEEYYRNVTPELHAGLVSDDSFWGLWGKIAESIPVATVFAEYKPKWQADIDKILESKGVIMDGKPFAGMELIDFEDGKIAPAKGDEEVISITDAPEEIIDGKYSLKIKVEPEWKTMFSIDTSYVKIEPGHTYKITLDYKIIEDLKQDGKYFFKFQHKEGSVGWVEFKGAKGEKGTVESEIPVYEDTGELFLDFGAYNGSVIAIDNINIIAKE